MTCRVSAGFAALLVLVLLFATTLVVVRTAVDPWWAVIGMPLVSWWWFHALVLTVFEVVLRDDEVAFRSLLRARVFSVVEIQRIDVPFWGLDQLFVRFRAIGRPVLALRRMTGLTELIATLRRRSPGVEVAGL